MSFPSFLNLPLCILKKVTYTQAGRSKRDQAIILEALLPRPSIGHYPPYSNVSSSSQCSRPLSGWSLYLKSPSWLSQAHHRAELSSPVGCPALFHPLTLILHVPDPQRCLRVPASTPPPSLESWQALCESLSINTLRDKMNKRACGAAEKQQEVPGVLLLRKHPIQGRCLCLLPLSLREARGAFS